MDTRRAAKNYFFIFKWRSVVAAVITVVIGPCLCICSTDQADPKPESNSRRRDDTSNNNIFLHGGAVGRGY